MVRGIEAAAAGMASIMNWNDIIANNLANVNTPGFKQTLVSFRNIQNMEVKDYPLNNDKSKPLGILSAGSTLDLAALDMKQGAIKMTGNPLDLSINGNGFFVIQTPQGEAYTRNGSFIRNQDGEITTIEGYPLMGESGPISANSSNANVQDIVIDKNGNVSVNQKLTDKLKIVDFTNASALQPLGNSLYAASNNQSIITPDKYEINQGSLEMANSNPIESMISSINGSRAYETLAKVIETENRSVTKTATEVGRVKR